MESNRTERNMEEMVMAGGGWNLKKWISHVGISTTLGGAAAGMIALAASGPVGWAILGGAAVGAAGAAIYTAVTDDD